MIDILGYARKALVSIFEREIGRQATASERHEIEGLLDEIMESHEYTPISDEEVEQDANAVRKHNARALLHLIGVAEKIASSENFYDLDKNIGDFIYVKTKMQEEQIHLTNDEIDTVIRLCRSYYAKGMCQHELSQAEIRNIHNWETYYFNDLYIINDIAASFKTYWDDVLTGYKKTSARLNRINYLINHLNEMKGKGTIQLLPNYEEKINELIQYYKSML